MPGKVLERILKEFLPEEIPERSQEDSLKEPYMSPWKEESGRNVWKKPDEIQGGINKGIPGIIPGEISERMPDGFFGGIPGGIHEGVQGVPWNNLETNLMETHDISLWRNHRRNTCKNLGTNSRRVTWNHFNITITKFILYLYDLYKTSGEWSMSVPLDFISLTPFTVTPAMVIAGAKKMKSPLSAGPDGMPSVLLCRCVAVLAEPLSVIFTRSLNDSVFLEIWKQSFMFHVFKKVILLSLRTTGE